jgi:hypothetical protein
MAKYLSFHKSFFDLKFFLLMLMARPQCYTPLVSFGEGGEPFDYLVFYYSHNVFMLGSNALQAREFQK